MTDLDPWVRELLRCPTCRGQLSDDPHGLRCAACGVYRVVDGIPVLLPGETTG
ncbi:MAG TPA: hypothetical protein P5181_12375 [Dermatophilaceae bacterium]|nr:hypothetical protein [Dermatophilaceae bacterium]